MVQSRTGMGKYSHFVVEQQGMECRLFFGNERIT